MIYRAVHLDMMQVTRDAFGMVLALRRGDLQGAFLLWRPYDADPNMRGTYLGALAAISIKLAEDLATERGVDVDQMLSEQAAALGGVG